MNKFEGHGPIQEPSGDICVRDSLDDKEKIKAIDRKNRLIEY